MRRTVFWATFAILGLIANLALPFWWVLVATIPIGLAAAGSLTEAIALTQILICR
jgi:hypothetical protein